MSTARRRRGNAARPGTPRGRIGSVGVDLPAAVDLEVVVEGATQRLGLADRPVRAAADVDHVQKGVPIARRLRGDPLVGWVVVAPDGGLLGRVELPREREDPVGAVHPVDLVAVGDVEITRLLGRVAVQRRRLAAHGHERIVVDERHVPWDVRGGVAVRPEDELAVRVQRDVSPDLLDPADDPAVDEVADDPRLRCRPGGPAAVRDRRWPRRRSAAASPVVAVVAIDVGPDVARPGVWLAVLAPRAVGRVGAVNAGQVVLGTVRVDVEDDPDLASVHEGGHGRVRPVVVGEEMERVEGLLERQVLAGVVEGVEEDLGLGLVRGDVVADLGDPDVPTLVALADRVDLDDVGVGRGDGVDLGDHLVVAVIERIPRREIGGGCRRGGAAEHDRGERDGRCDTGEKTRQRAAVTSNHGPEGDGIGGRMQL